MRHCNELQMCYYRVRSRKFPSVPRNENHPTVPVCMSGTKHGDQAGERTKSTVSASFTERESFCQNWREDSLRPYTGDAGKDSLDGIRYFAGFGNQSMAPDSCSPREEGHPPVLRDLDRKSVV